eukprot:1218381-Rhodomonas_salina.1
MHTRSQYRSLPRAGVGGQGAHHPADVAVGFLSHHFHDHDGVDKLVDVRCHDEDHCPPVPAARASAVSKKIARSRDRAEELREWERKGETGVGGASMGVRTHSGICAG